MYNCIYCNKELKSPSGKGAHMVYCISNPNRIIPFSMSKEKRTELNQKIMANKKDKTYENLYGLERALEIKNKLSNSKIGKKLSKETKEKISFKNKNNPKLIGGIKDQIKELNRRLKISETCKKNKLSGGYRIGSGRSNGDWYDSHIAGRVYLDSSYEIRYAKWLDINNINWKRNLDKFEYYFNDKKSYYIPDFYLIDLCKFIEIKGFKTEKDEAKWKHFPHMLDILFDLDLKNLGI